MKQICTFIFLFLLSLQNQTFAQVLLSQDFSTGSAQTPPTGWSNITTFGDVTLDKWNFNNPGGYLIGPPMSGKVATFDSYNSGNPGGVNNNLAEEAILESPTFSTTGLSNLVLEFDHILLRLANATAFVEISTNGGGVWTSVFSSTAQMMTPVKEVLNLSATFNNQPTVKLRFRWNQPVAASNNGYWQFDNVKLYSKFANDLMVTALTSPLELSCPSATQPVRVTVKNNGTATQTNVPIRVDITGPVTQTFTDNIASLAAGATVTLFPTASISTVAGGSFTYKIYTQGVTDQDRTNDTLNTVIITAPAPATPNGSNVTRCGVGSLTLNVSQNTGDSTVWYTTSTGSVVAGLGNPFTTPVIPVTTTFYPENTRHLSREIILYNGPYRFNFAAVTGSMFNITATNELIIDSFDCNFAYAGNYTIDVFYKAGTYVGFQTSAASWTLMGSKLVTAGSLNNLTKVRIGGLRIPLGQTYGIYIRATLLNGSMAFKLGNLTYSNSDMVVSGGDVLSGSFTANLNGYTVDGKIYYRKVCKSPRTSVQAIVLRLPHGSSLAKGTPFLGLYKTGSPADMDVAAGGDQMSYSLVPPAGYTNSSYGTDWTLTATLKTTTGATVSGLTKVNPGAGNGTMTFTPNISYTDSVFNLDVLLHSNLTGCDSLVRRVIYIAPKPVANFTAVPVCLGEQTVFVNQATILKGSMTFFWDLGDGSTTGARFPRHKYAAAGSYNVKLVATSNYGYKDSITKIVVVNESPTANFTPKFACDGEALLFTNTSTGPAGLTYAWDFGDGNNSNATNPNHMYNAPNSYSVTLVTSTPAGCSNARTKTVFQFPNPIASFTAASGCQDDDAVFTNGSTISNGGLGTTWTFGDGAGSEDTDSKHKYLNPGTYTVTLISTSLFGCDDTSTQQVTIIATPKAGFSSTNVCKGAPSDFTNGSTIATGNTFTSTWDFNDGNTSNSVSPSHTYLGSGTYAVKLTVSNGTCSDEIVKSVEVYEKPTAGFNAANVCLNSNTQFVNTSNLSSGNANFNWSFGDGNTSTSTNVSHKYGTAGQKTVWLKVMSDAGCADSISKVVEVFPNPTSVIAISHVSGRKYNFSTTSTGAYSWAFGDATRSSTQNPQYEYFFDGTFNVCLKVTSAQSCENEACTTLVVSTFGMSAVQTDASHIMVYPNPSRDVFNIKSSSESYTVSVYDVYGKLVKEVPASEVKGGETTINMAGSSAGVYLLKVNEGGQISVKRITIQ